MKLFCKKKHQSALTPEQVAMVRKIYEERGCAYCAKLRSAVSWWCGSEEAIAARHTAIPGVVHCLFWHPDKLYIRKQLKAENDKK